MAVATSTAAQKKILKKINGTDLPSSNWYRNFERDQVLAIYPTSYAYCRTHGHRWPGPEDSIQLVKWIDGSGWSDREVQCIRCLLVKTEHYDAAREHRIAPSDMDYPRGYLTPKTGMGKPDFRSVTHQAEFERAQKAGRTFSAADDN